MKQNYKKIGKLGSYKLIKTYMKEGVRAGTIMGGGGVYGWGRKVFKGDRRLRESVESYL